MHVYFSTNRKERLAHFFDFSKVKTLYIWCSVISVICLLVLTILQMMRPFRSCNLLVTTPSYGCCVCVCNITAFEPMCTNTVGAAFNPDENPIDQEEYLSNWVAGTGVLVASLVCFVQIYHAHRNENLYLCGSVIFVVVIECSRVVYLSVTAKDFSFDDPVDLARVVLVGVSMLFAVVCLFLIVQLNKQFGTRQYERNCMTDLRQRIFKWYKIIVATQWIDLQLALAFFCMVLFTERENMELLGCTVAMFSCDLMAMLATGHYMRQENRRGSFIAVAFKAFSTASWVVLGIHYYHCFADFKNLATVMSNFFIARNGGTGSYLWPSAASLHGIFDHSLTICVASRTMHSSALAIFMACVLAVATIVRVASVFCSFSMIRFYTGSRGEISKIFRKGEITQLKRKEAILEVY